MKSLIALTDPAQITALPMMNAMLRQAGVDPSVVLSRWRGFEAPGLGEKYAVFNADVQTMEPGHATYRFAEKHHLQSLVGFAGVLHGGGLFGVTLFNRVPVSPQAARMFQTLAHSTTYGGFAKSGIPVFTDGPRTDQADNALSACQRTVIQKNILAAVLHDHERLSASALDATAQALERSRFDAQRYAALARTLQVILLPQELPVVAGLQSSAYFRPAGDGTEIGGDFYDLFPISENRFGFALGDVSGKGAQAAVLTAFARHTLRSAAVASTDPGQVLRTLDQAIANRDAEDRYLTALFAYVTVQPGLVTLHLALGGHPRPFVLRANGTVESAGIAGSAVGLFPNPEFAAVDVVLRPGDAFVAYTDGVTEARRGDEEFGEDRLRVSLSDQQGHHPSRITANIAAQLLEFQHGIAHDDAALVILRCQ